MSDEDEKLVANFNDDFQKLSNYLQENFVSSDFVKLVWLNSIEHLTKNTEPLNFFNDENSLHCLSCVHLSTSDLISFDSLNPDTQTNYLNYLLKLAEQIFKNIDQLLKKLNEESREFQSLNFTVRQIIYFTDKNVNFSIQLSKLNGVKVLFDLFKVCMKKLIKLNEAENCLEPLCECISLCLFNLSKVKYRFVKQWKEINALKTLFLLADQIKEKTYFSKIHLNIYLTIAFLFEEKDVEKLTDLKPVIKLISDLIEQFASLIKKGTQFRREFRLEENDEKLYEISFLNGWNLIELFECLYRLAVNDMIKYEIYDEYECKSYLRSIVYKGNEIEREYSLKVLSQLCFDSRVANDVKSDNKLFALIKSESGKESNKRMAHVCSSIIWLMQEKHEVKKCEEENSKQRHVMISYNSKSRDLCLSVKGELEKMGHKVWIDVEDIHGSSLDSMANAIEKSSCVLMCMTEKYKQSANCRLEAEYAVNQNKPIIPLIMEKSYKPDGWLGIILGTKIFIDFTKYELKECITRLLKEIHTLSPPPTTTTQTTKPKNDIEKKDENNKILSWSENDVNKWLEEKKFIKEIVECVQPCNGELLAQMHNMLQTVPEFFFNSINVNKRMKLRDLAFFTNELIKLFKI